MANCCQEKSCDLEKMAKGQSKVLWIVLIINVIMFIVELTGGIFAESLALTGDSLDMLWDAIAYSSSLYVINKGPSAKAFSASLKGGIMIFSGLSIFFLALWRIFHSVPPQSSLMGVVALAALLANALCLFFLTRHRNDDINMTSVWLCSRNDLIANTSVLVAAGLVALTASSWPDLIIGIGITVLFLKSGIGVLVNAQSQLSAK